MSRSAGSHPQAACSDAMPASSDAVGVHGALGLAGGARGVDDERVVARLRLGQRAAARPARPPGPARPRARPATPGPKRSARPGSVGRWPAPGRRRPRRGPTSARGADGLTGTRTAPARSTASEGPDGLEGGAGPPQDPVPRTDAVRRRGPTPPRRCAGRARRRRRPRALPPVDEHGASGRAAHRRAHTSGSVRPGSGGVRRASAPGGRAPSPPATAGHSLAVMTARRIAIVPHTHWDREWYKSYQDFRLALVELIDTLIPLLERDASYPHFMLDGQMAVVDDYLEVRPEAEERLRALAAAGRLSMGPWYILMDEFLASGETIVRNLQMGLVRGAAFGGVMDVGYLPDMFGHIAQMPQILRLAGFRDAVVWRGVPSAGDQERLRVGGTRRIGGPRRVPARRATATAPRSPTTPRRSCAAPRDHVRGGRRLPHRRPALHERVGPPDAPAMARPGRGRGQRPAGRLPLRGHLAPALPGRHAPPRA